MIHLEHVAAGAFALALLLLPSVGEAQTPPGACLCPSGAEQLLEQTDHVFVGDLLEVKGSGADAGVAMIRVHENFKGALTGVVAVRDVLGTRCAWSVFEMALPGRYMVFANLDEGDLVTPSFCPQTQPIGGWKDRLAPFRAYARAHKPPAPAAKPAPTAAGPAAPAPKTGS